MGVLYSAKLFNEKYVEGVSPFARGIAAATGGAAVAGGMMTAAGTAAASASAWSLFSGLPLVGSLAAGKAVAVGFSAAFGPMVLIPALLLAGGAAYAASRAVEGKHTMQKTSPADALADAFANIAFLPMAAKIKDIVDHCPDLAQTLCGRGFRKMREWGYDDGYIKSLCNVYVRMSPEEIRRQYRNRLNQLRKGNVRVFNCKGSELPAELVESYAQSFEKEI